MSELNSRIYLATEAIVICLPLTVLFVVGVLPAQIYHAINFTGQQALVDLASGLAMLATLFCLWRLMAAFIVLGSAALRRLSAYWWVSSLASAALVVRITVHLSSALVIEPSWLSEFGWGVPLLIPLLHLCVERWLRSSAHRTLSADAPPLGLRTRGGPPVTWLAGAALSHTGKPVARPANFRDRD